MPATEADFTSLSLDGAAFLADQWLFLAPAVQSLNAFFLGKQSNGAVEPTDVLTGLAFGIDGQDVNHLDWRVFVTAANAFEIQENTGTDGAPTWVARLVAGAGGGADHGGLAGLGDDDHTQYALVTGARDFTGDVTLDGAAATRALIINSTINGTAEVILQDAGTEAWALQCGNAQEFVLQWLNTDRVMVVEANAPATALHIDSDGHIGFGVNPTASFAFWAQGTARFLFEHAADTAGAFMLSAGLVADQNISLEFAHRGITEWELTVAAVDDAFRLINGVDTVLTVEDTAPANSFYIDADGHVGFGRDPNASNWVFDNNADAAVLFDLDSGSTAAQDITMRFLDRGTNQWAIRSVASSGNFIGIDSGSVTWMIIEDGVDANAFYIDADGHVGFGLNPTVSFGLNCIAGNAWRFHNQADAAGAFNIGTGSTALQTTDLNWVDHNDAVIFQMRVLNSAPDIWRLRDATNNIISVEVGSIAQALQIDATGIGFFNTAPVARPAAYTLNATQAPSRTLLQSSAATATNNNNVLSQVIQDLQALGLLQ